MKIRLEFDCDLDARAVTEIRDKGYFLHGVGVLPDGRRVHLAFWDPTRLAQDLETRIKLGRTCIGEPGMIIIPSVTPDNMRAAVNELYERGYFDHFR